MHLVFDFSPVSRFVFSVGLKQNKGRTTDVYELTINSPYYAKFTDANGVFYAMRLPSGWKLVGVFSRCTGSFGVNGRDLWM